MFCSFSLSSFCRQLSKQIKQIKTSEFLLAEVINQYAQCIQ